MKLYHRGTDEISIGTKHEKAENLKTSPGRGLVKIILDTDVLRLWQISTFPGFGFSR
jgi:hypothetical protein